MMSRWIEVNIVHKVLWGIVILLVSVGLVEKLFALYGEFVHVQPDVLILSVLLAALLLQGIGGIGLLQSSKRWRRVSFGVLYVVGIGELLLYIGNAVMLSQPDICNTLVGNEPVEPLVGQASFLGLLGGMHWTESYHSNEEGERRSSIS